MLCLKLPTYKNTLFLQHRYYRRLLSACLFGPCIPGFAYISERTYAIIEKWPRLHSGTLKILLIKLECNSSQSKVETVSVAPSHPALSLNTLTSWEPSSHSPHTEHDGQFSVAVAEIQPASSALRRPQLSPWLTSYAAAHTQKAESPAGYGSGFVMACFPIACWNCSCTNTWLAWLAIHVNFTRMKSSCSP